MTNPETTVAKTTIAKDGMIENAQVSFVADERRLQDALEDDEVRENLRTLHQHQQPVSSTPSTK